MRRFSSCLLLAWCSTALPAQVSDRPHIVLVMADDQGYGDMGYAGHAKLKTPNFDTAAAAGLRFDRFYAAAPVCSPTRASVLTGRHPNRMGVFKWGYSMRPQERTVAEELKAAGYVTGHFGKWHLGSMQAGSPDSPGANGFDEWLSAPNYYDNDPLMSRRGKVERVPGESSMIAVDAALAWMETKRGGAAPMFTVVWFGSPHAPHRAAEVDAALYKSERGPVRNFYGEITGMDRAFGKLRSTLERWKIRDNTLLWYCSDNGALPRLGDTGGHRGHKGQVFEGGLLVPAFLEWPSRLRKPRRTDLRCNTCDFLPTLLAVAGIERKPGPVLDGVDLSPLLSDTPKEEALRQRPMGFWDRAQRGLAVHSDRRMAALLKAQKAGKPAALAARSRDAASLPKTPHALDAFPGHAAWIADGWKLHRVEKDGKRSYQLYDLGTDPFEERDLFATEKERAAGHQRALDRWLVSVAKSYNGADY